MSAIEDLIVRLAQTRVMRHLRATEYGIEDVETHWRDLPAVDRQAILDQMHAPASPELQAPDRFQVPDTRRLSDLSPGERAVYTAVQQNVGERKLATLQAKVKAGGGNPYARQAGYLKSRLAMKPRFATGDRVVITDHRGSQRAGTVSGDSGYGSYVVDMDGTPEVQQVDESSMTPIEQPASISNKMEMDDDPDWRNTAYAAADEAAGLLGVARTPVGDRLAELRAVVDGGTSSEVADAIDEARSALDSSDLSDLLRGEAEYAIRMAGNYLAARREMFNEPDPGIRSGSEMPVASRPPTQFPEKIRLDSPRKTLNDLKQADRALLEQARQKAQDEGDDYVLALFKNLRPGPSAMSSSDRSLLNTYLFG